MARLQILELPEGSSDDRPPFALVVDECAPQRYILGLDSSWQDHWQVLADKIGARGVITPDTLEIPGNDLTGYSGIPGGDYAAFAATVERALGIDASAAVPDVAGWLLTACRELEKSEAAREQLRQDLNERTAAIERVCATPTEPELMNADQERPDVWRHAYGIGVRAAKAALYPRNEPTTKPHDA